MCSLYWHMITYIISKLRSPNKVELKQNEIRCLNCGKPTTNKKFCNSACQGEASMKESYARLKEGTLTRPGTIRRTLLKFRKNECEICGNDTWNNKPIPLVADHIDGNPENNDLSNLRLICNNCDSQLPTYKGRNRGNGRHYRRERYKEGKSY